MLTLLSLGRLLDFFESGPAFLLALPLVFLLRSLTILFISFDFYIVFKNCGYKGYNVASGHHNNDNPLVHDCTAQIRESYTIPGTEQRCTRAMHDIDSHVACN